MVKKLLEAFEIPLIILQTHPYPCGISRKIGRPLCGIPQGLRPSQEGMHGGISKAFTVFGL
jgi:hypothetical protein